MTSPTELASRRSRSLSLRATRSIGRRESWKTSGRALLETMAWRRLWPLEPRWTL